MNSENPLTPREELEIRLTALLLGELTGEEAATFEEQIARDPELAATHARLRQAIELLREATAIPEPIAHPTPARLSTERRQKLLEHFSTVEGGTLVNAECGTRNAERERTRLERSKNSSPSAAGPARRREWGWLVPLSLAAAFIALIGGSLFLNGMIGESLFLNRVAAPGTTHGSTMMIVKAPSARTTFWGFFAAPQQVDHGLKAITATESTKWEKPGLASAAVSGDAGARGRTSGKIDAIVSDDIARRGLRESRPGGGGNGQRGGRGGSQALSQLTANAKNTALGDLASTDVSAPAPATSVGAPQSSSAPEDAAALAGPPASDASKTKSFGGFAELGNEQPILGWKEEVPALLTEPDKSLALVEPAPANAAPPAVPFENKEGPSVNQLLVDADAFSRTGRLDPASKRYEQALNIDPYNIAARKGQEELTLTRENSKISADNEGRSRSTWNLDAAWSNPVRRFDVEKGGGIAPRPGASPELAPESQPAASAAQDSKPEMFAESPVLGDRAVVGDRFGVSLDRKEKLSRSDRNEVEVNGKNLYLGTTAVTGGAGATQDVKSTVQLGDIGQVSGKDEKAADGTRYLNEVDGQGVVAGRTSFYDESTKLSLNTASEGAFRNTPSQQQAGGDAPDGKKIEELMEKETSGALSVGKPLSIEPGLATSQDRFFKSVDADKLVKADVAKLTKAGQKVREQDLPVNGPPASAPEPQPEIQTSDNAFSTFSLNVSDVAFKLAAASLEKGVMPEVATVRSEEFINAFDYRDPEPAAGAPLAFVSERARYPFAQNRDLLRLSVKTAAAGRQPGRALNLVLLLDNSGSMERADRVRILREALRVLAGQLQTQDKLSIITFARTARLWADGLDGKQAGEAIARVGEITPQGGTNVASALDLGYQTALKHYQVGSINRVVLLTDGAANLGDVDPVALKQKVEAHRKKGIALDCFGIGWEGYNDDLLEVLSRNGDGRYGFINTPEQAATEFAGQLAGALRVAASDVKVQVEFNPRRVTAYRQIGYAKHQLTKEQFRDNTVDAAEIGAAESGNALYVVEVNPRGEGDLATVRVRFKVPGTADYREQAWSVPFAGHALPLEQATPALRLAATAGAFAEWLAASPYAAEVTPDRLLGYLNGVPEIYGADPRPKKLEWMIRQAKSVSGR